MTMKTGPPGIPEEMFSVHLRYAAKTMSIWTIEIEWTEEGMVGHWQLSASPTGGHAKEWKRITVDVRS
jgi:hypothetical protein